MIAETSDRTDQGTPIPLPDDFPVVWEQPGDELKHWRRSRWQHPSQPIGLYVTNVIFGGFNQFLVNNGFRLRFENRQFNTYGYFRVYLDESMPELSATQIRNVYDGQMERWRGEILPEFEQIVAELDAIDLSELDLSELISQLDDDRPIFQQAALLHFQAMIPIELAMHEYLVLYRDLFSDAAPTDPFRLLQGQEVATVATGDLLWAYSRRALDSEELTRIVTDNQPADAVVKLQQSDTGREFIADLERDLNELPYPWLRDPVTALGHIRNYVIQPDRDFAAERKAQAGDRDRQLAEVRARLRGYPKPVRDEFEYLLGMACDFTIISEEHQAKLDLPWLIRINTLIAEVGRRFADADVLDDPEDISYLYIEEIRDQPAILQDPDLRDRIAERKARCEHFAGINPPHELGVRPATKIDDPVYGIVVEDFGEPPAPPAKEGELTGNPASAGTVQGIARIIITMDDADRLEPGDILVTRLTTPDWTPLFAVASAVVTDYGGALIHAAVVAREYGIPAVVGTGYATTTLHDGDLIEVDGAAGTVKVLDG